MDIFDYICNAMVWFGVLDMCIVAVVYREKIFNAFVWTLKRVYTVHLRVKSIYICLKAKAAKKTRKPRRTARNAKIKVYGYIGDKIRSAADRARVENLVESIEDMTQYGKGA